LLVQGWLLDCYPSKTSSGMTAWIKTEDGRVLQLKDRAWHAKIYAGGQACENIDYFVMRADAKNLIHSISHAFKRSDFFDTRKKRVLEIELADANKTRKLAELLERAFRNPKAMQLYNVDVMPEQQYFLEKDLFPLAFVEVDATDDGEVRRWTTLDSASSCVYETPKLKILRLALEIEDLVPRLDSKLVSISLFSPEDGKEKKKEEEQERKIAKIEGTSELDIIRELGENVEAFDPDLIITQNGDAFVLPFLYTKAAKFGIDLHSKLNRDHELSSSSNEQKSGGKTYFSYGRILYRPTTHRLFGRLHLDEENTFVYDQCMLEGLFEVSRLCRMPIHTSMRASIGKCLSGLQFYYAYKEDILIPWKPEIPEDFKMGQELFDDDRGGLVLKPLFGVREHVGELDFASLYPSIIKSFNISAETVNCSCCGEDSDSPSKFQIEELHMHVCERKKGIVARSLAQPLLKKAWYKTLRDTAKKNGDEVLARKYNERAASLKWILVCCLAKESRVLIKTNGATLYVRIGSFIDSLVGKKEGIVDCTCSVLVAGVDHNLKSKFCKVKKLLKIPNMCKLLKITMDDGREIIATPNHPFYLLKNGSLEVEDASYLREGNLIPFANKLPSAELTEEFIEEPFVERSAKLQTIEKIAIPNKKLGQQSIISFKNTRRMFQGDLGFARIRKIEELSDRTDDHVYCFELEDGEVPGFFAGDGAVFTHNCFGYLSYRNAKFGKIDSHIAVCALARKTLVEAMHVSEYNGFRVVHGIVDSLWLEKKNASESDYMELRAKIEEQTKFKLAFEGIYKWVVFLPSKTYPGKQVANRYFGVFETGEIKTRGIEMRRHDAPLYFKKCQKEILEELAKCENERELCICARQRCVDIFERYALDLEGHKVSPTELLIKRRLSKNPSEYSSARQLSVNAASHLERRGLALKAGQSVSYVITRYKSYSVNRSTPEQLVVGDSNLEYDSERYVELLADACATLLTPFGVTKEELLGRSRSLLAW
jgi:DNA polymerase elongation subunit (family B)